MEELSCREMGELRCVGGWVGDKYLYAFQSKVGLVDVKRLGGQLVALLLVHLLALQDLYGGEEWVGGWMNER